MDAIARYDVTAKLSRVRAQLLFVLSRTDVMFPPAPAKDVMPMLAAAGIDASYFEIGSDAGHFSSSADADQWAPALSAFLNSLETSR